MKTQFTLVKCSVDIWARPRRSWEDDGTSPFVFLDRRPYDDLEVKVCTHEVELTVPAGIDLVSRAIHTLEEKRDKIITDAKVEAMKVQEQINSLLCLPAPAEPNFDEFMANGGVICDDPAPAGEDWTAEVIIDPAPDYSATVADDADWHGADFSPS